jgi:hypothetical protein
MYMEESVADDGREMTTPVPQQILSISEMLSEKRSPQAVDESRGRWSISRAIGQQGPRAVQKRIAALGPSHVDGRRVGYIWQ